MNPSNEFLTCPYHKDTNNKLIKDIARETADIPRRRRRNRKCSNASIGILWTSCQTSEICNFYSERDNGSSYKRVIKLFNHDFLSKYCKIDHNGSSLIHREIESGKFVEASITAEKTDLRRVNRDGFTPLMMVISSRIHLIKFYKRDDHTEETRITLIKILMDVNDLIKVIYRCLKGYNLQHGHTDLERALYDDDLEAFKELRHKYKFYSRINALHIASSMGRMEILKFLVEEDEKYRNVQGSCNPLMIASQLHQMSGSEITSAVVRREGTPLAEKLALQQWKKFFDR